MYSPNTKQLNITDFIGGLNVTKPPSEINDNQSPDCLNTINNELHGLNSRYGYDNYYPSSIGSATINNIFTHNTYSSTDFLIAQGTSLKKDLSSAATAIYSGLVSGTVRSFEMDGNTYFQDGSGYIVYDGSSAESVSGFIPTYYVNKHPDGSNGYKLYELNYIQSGFIETFNGDGSSLNYYMSYGDLTTQTPTVLVNNVTQTMSAASAGFTVDYASGYITLTTAINTGVGNVSIQVYKPVLDATAITNCTFNTTYGEGNDTFVFMSGNESFPARIHWSDTMDPTYFPATSFADVGVINDKMTSFLPYNGNLLLLKNRSLHSYNGTPGSYSITEVYKKNEGCICTDSVQLIEGLPTFESQRGIVQLTGSAEGYDLVLISEDINGREGIRNGILTETSANKSSAFSYEFDNKYWFKIGDYIYIYQYDLKHTREGKVVYPWLRWDLNETPTCFVEKDNYLYFGGSENIFKLDPNSTSDNGTAIDAYYYTKKLQINNSHDWIKNFLYTYMDFNTRLGTPFNTTITAYIDDKEITLPVASLYAEFFDPNNFDPNEFNPNAVDSNIEIRLPIHKKGKFIQFKLRCNTLNNMFNIASLKIDYMLDRKVR